MPIETKVVTLSSDTETFEYTIAQFGATKGLTYLKQITKLIGPSFSELFAGKDVDSKLEDVPDAGLTKAVELLVDGMDKVDVEKLIKDLLSNTTKNGREINFDFEFAGKYDILFSLVMEVVKFNFGSVFTKSVLSGS